MRGNSELYRTDSVLYNSLFPLTFFDFYIFLLGGVRSALYVCLFVYMHVDSMDVDRAAFPFLRGSISKLSSLGLMSSQWRDKRERV